jgi:hypothetical protein
MTDPLRRLQYLPWRSLLQVAGFTIVIVIILECLLALGYTQSSVIRSRLLALYRPPLAIVLLFATGFGVGVLAVHFLERYHQKVFINTATLWALIPCLALVIFLNSLLPVPPVVNLNIPQLLGVIVGVFWKGRPYWRMTRF